MWQVATGTWERHAILHRTGKVRVGDGSGLAGDTVNPHRDTRSGVCPKVWPLLHSTVLGIFYRVHRTRRRLHPSLFLLLHSPMAILQRLARTARPIRWHSFSSLRTLTSRSSRPLPPSIYHSTFLFWISFCDLQLVNFDQQWFFFFLFF